VGHVFGGVPVWQMLVHVVNHGTQHRAEVAALLTAEGRSPGELDLINYADELRRVRQQTVQTLPAESSRRCSAGNR
jgi:uncharacterized damage-inducible protein DinB